MDGGPYPGLVALSLADALDLAAAEIAARHDACVELQAIVERLAGEATAAHDLSGLQALDETTQVLAEIAAYLGELALLAAQPERGGVHDALRGVRLLSLRERLAGHCSHDDCAEGGEPELF